MFSFFKAMTLKAFREGERTASDRIYEQTQAARREEVTQFLGMPVILITNEWENPVIGFGESLIEYEGDRVPHLAIKDFISGEILCGSGPLMAFTPQRLEALLALDPYQIWALTGQMKSSAQDYTKPRTGERWDKARIQEVLQCSGFWQQYTEFCKNSRIE